MEILSQSNRSNDPSNTSRNNNKKSSKSKNTCAYKASTFKQSKAKQSVTLGNNPNSNPRALSTTKSEKKFSKKPRSKISLSPEIRISSKRIHNNSYYEAKKIQNYTEMYMKNNNRNQNQNQRIKTTNNISINYYNIMQNNVRMIKPDYSPRNRLDHSNEKIIKQDNNNGNKNLFVGRDGKRYVLSKNVQRVRRDNGKIKMDEKKDFHINPDDRFNKTFNP